jgi:hypothetical protein
MIKPSKPPELKHCPSALVLPRIKIGELDPVESDVIHAGAP